MFCPLAPSSSLPSLEEVQEAQRANRNCFFYNYPWEGGCPYLIWVLQNLTKMTETQIPGLSGALCRLFQRTHEGLFSDSSFSSACNGCLPQWALAGEVFLSSVQSCWTSYWKGDLTSATHPLIHGKFSYSCQKMCWHANWSPPSQLLLSSPLSCSPSPCSCPQTQPFQELASLAVVQFLNTCSCFLELGRKKRRSS